MSEETPHRFFAAFFVGLLIYIGWWLVLPLLAATVIGLPIGIFLFQIFKWLGRAALLHYAGYRLGMSLGREVSLLAALFLGFIPFALIQLIPLYVDGFWGLTASLSFTTLFWLMVDVPGLGLVLLTRAGGRPAPATAPPVPTPPATP